MRVAVVDPPAYTPPYDHSLCAALARRGIEVELFTSRFRYGPVPPEDGYRRVERFYRRGAGSASLKAAQHPFAMLALAAELRRQPRGPVHFEWLPIRTLDARLVRRFPRPRVFTAHESLPRGARGLLKAMDAVVAHTRTGRERLVGELGVAPERAHVIPHGAFDYLMRQAEEAPIDPRAGDLEGRRVVLFFGLLRPYKGIDVLIEAFAGTPDDAVLLVVGMPRMPVRPLERLAGELGIADRVRFVPRFVSDPEVPAYFRHADLVVLPYLSIEHSGVLFTALAFGSPLILSAIGGFVEVATEHSAARLVPPGDAGSLRTAIVELLDDDEARARLAAAARKAASGPYSWERAAELTEKLYRSLLERTG
jgi:glycosyltransferase involved in cell wall biosynthesis